MKVASRKKIVGHPSKCTGCMICQLRCSLKFEKAFNPARSAIIIRKLTAGDSEYSILFTDRCDGCGICVRYCPYSALSETEEEGPLS
jgi:ferredoxin